MTATPPPATPMVAWEGPGTGRGPRARHRVRAARRPSRRLHHRCSIISAICLALAIVAITVLAAGATVADNEVTDLNPLTTAVFILLILAAIGVVLLYFPFFWARGGQTPGMRPFDLRVVRDRDGGTHRLGDGLLRLVGLWVAGAVFYLGYIWIFIDKRRRGWQDLIAGTIVIKQP